MNNELQHQINLETAQIRWHELQRFFAGGNAIAVDPSLNLTEVAAEIVSDNVLQLHQWMHTRLVGAVTDEQALEWFNSDASVWAVVVKPWVLVQLIINEAH